MHTSATHSTTVSRRRVLAAGAVVLALGATPVVAAPAVASDRDHAATSQRQGPQSIDLPAGFQPEGIEIGPGGIGYVGSRVDGDLYRFSLRTGRGEVFSQGPGTPSLGVKIDRRGRLFVAGGSGGDLRVVDARSGRTLVSYRLTTGTAFINDVVLTRDAAYVTDSANANLYEIPFGRAGRLPAAGDVRRIPLTGDWEQVAGNNANGITTTPDGKALVVVNSTKGLLYRVDARTGVARTIDLGGYSVANGDGLLLRGRTLYVVQNRQNLVAVLRLDRSGRSGRLERTITSPLFDVPSTVAASGDQLYLPNARFTTPPTPATAYAVTRVSAR